MSHVMCHVNNIFQLKKLKRGADKFVEIVGEWVYYQWGLPCLVFLILYTSELYPKPSAQIFGMKIDTVSHFEQILLVELHPFTLY